MSPLSLRSLALMSVCALSLALPAFAADTAAGDSSGSMSDTSKVGSSSGSSGAGVVENTDQASAAKANPADIGILSHLHSVNLQEISAGKLAQDKAASDSVKAYGEQMVKDHQSADTQVMQLARKLNMEPSGWATTPDRADQAMMKRLEASSGKAFDRRFTKAMSMGHEKAINWALSAQKKANSQEVKDLLTQLLPKLRHHKEMAGELSRTGGNPST